MRNHKPLDRIIQPITPKMMSLRHTLDGLSHFLRRSEDSVNIFRARARVIDQAHHRPTVQANLPLDV